MSGAPLLWPSAKDRAGPILHDYSIKPKEMKHTSIRIAMLAVRKPLLFDV